MEICYLLNKNISNECVKKSTDSSITIESKNAYTSPKIDGEDFSFIRFYINFDKSSIEPNCNNIEVFLDFRPKGVVSNAGAVGMFIRVPIRTCTVNSGSSEEIVCYSDGDIPIYDNDIRIIVKNNKSVSHILRNITVIKNR